MAELRPIPAIESEARDEIGATLLTGLVAATPRRGLAALPDVTLDLIAIPAGRLLVAAAPGSPFVLFARPAPGPGSLREGLRAFLATWPSGTAIGGPPALADLDPGGRIRPRPGSGGGFRPLVPDADSAEMTALLAQAAGSLLAIFVSRVEGALDGLSIERARDRLTRPARVIATRDVLTVRFGPGGVDLAVRRAGLDRDPGWVPWLKATVRFEYEGADREPEWTP